MRSPLACARAMSWAWPAMISSALTASPVSPKAPGIPMSLIPSSTITQRAPDCARTSRSNRASAFGPTKSWRTRLPLMPWSTTAMSAVRRFSCRRAARKFGQRWFASTVEA